MGAGAAFGPLATSGRERDVLGCRVEERRCPEIADHLDVPVNFVRAHTSFRGIEMLRAPDSAAEGPDTEGVLLDLHAPDDRAVFQPGLPPVPARPIMGLRSINGLHAALLVLPVDAAMLLTPALWVPQHWRAFVALAVVGLMMLTGGGRYRAKLHVSVLDELPRILARLLTAAAAVATAFALWNPGEPITPFLGASVWSLGLVVVGRVVTTQAILTARRRRLVAHRTILVGGGALATEIAMLLQRYPRYGLAVAGFVDDGSSCPAAAVIPHLGRIHDLDLAVAANDADVVLVTEGDFSEVELLEVVRLPDCTDVDLLVVPRLHPFHTQTGDADHVGAVPVMRVRSPAMRGLYWTLKRVVDVVVSAAALLLLAPVLAACAAAVRWEGGPGVLFRQERVGRGGRTFQCLKFRSMRPATSSESATQWNIATDARVGWVGRVLRRTSLDELPQLVNVLRGDMTLVGPRPERPHFVEQFSRQYFRYEHRHRVPAGLTGLAQVSGLRGDTPIADRARFDNYYIENWSLWLDLKVVLRTIGEMIFARGR
ncbi:exopolysaccharide biosynthesis polyprenyl glycosylphosphotransferase [Actinomycetospora callitridis]|uniref:exopolysaccharide biosynthesis polyprenyl glycosylphosphotransferase n=1 Tax=Actinomycetospora callitridis TaxID=913944 RepID=UPI0023652A21|nr:exopolysaccharide biosynthesis polyprenyl glycosylphosphotransferase [Actinomycetospora callitridis]MDD7917617.1 exopolysaccharide biosynthesis polyprenyl glycosylphosphotransferase [Actinomycetospora callitridis]